MTYPVRLLGAPWAGGWKQNPAYEPIERFVEVMGLCAQVTAGWLRFNSGVDVGGPANLEFQAELAREIVARKLKTFLVFGDVRASVPNCQLTFDVFHKAYADAGLDPKLYLIASAGSENGNYGGGDPLRTAPKTREGMWEPDVIENIRRLARGLNTRGCILALGSFEAEKPETLTREIASVLTLGKDLYLFGAIGLSCYIGKGQTWAQGIGWRLRPILQAFGYLGVPTIVTEANREGGHVASPAAALDEIIIAGPVQGAGWYAGYDKFYPVFSMIPVKKSGDSAL